MCRLSTLIAVSLLSCVSTATATAAAAPATGPSKVHSGQAKPAKDDAHSPSGQRALANELQDDIASLVKTYPDLFGDPWLRHAKIHFGLAEQAAKVLVVEDHPNQVAINDFHYGLGKFARALDEVTKWQPGTTGWNDVKPLPKPELKRLKAMAAAVRMTLAKASRVPEFRSVETVVFSDATSFAEAAAYGQCALKNVVRDLHEGMLESITGGGIAKTDEITKKRLDKLGAAIAALDDDLDPSADAAAQSAELARRVAAAKAAIADVETAFDELTRSLPPAQPRIAWAELTLKVLQANLGRLRTAASKSKTSKDTEARFRAR